MTAIEKYEKYTKQVAGEAQYLATRLFDTETPKSHRTAAADMFLDIE